jgi:hypothetical protein
MKKVAATNGHKVRRADFFFSGKGESPDRDLAETVAVANFDGVLLGTNHSQLPSLAGRAGKLRIPATTLKLVRYRRIRHFSTDASNFLFM